MTKCAICDNPVVVDDRKLCERCTMERLASASLDRIFSRRGLNYENALAYSEENYIKAYIEGSK